MNSQTINMYNEEIKQQYIDYCTANKNVRAEKFLPPLFRRTAETETKLHKDVCNFTLKEIVEMYQSLYTTSYTSLMNIHSHLRDYTTWCGGRMLLIDHINHYAEIDTATIRRCLHDGLKKEQIVTRADLIDLLNGNDISNTYEKVWILGVFEGLSGKAGGDMLHLKRDMIDFVNQEVHLPESGRTLSISKELTILMELALGETEYTTVKRDRTMLFRKGSEDVLFKPSCNGQGEFAAQNLFRQMLLRYSQSLELPYLNTYSLKTSGEIHYIRELMCADGCTDPLITYANHKADIELRYGVLSGFYHFELYADAYKMD